MARPARPRSRQLPTGLRPARGLRRDRGRPSARCRALAILGSKGVPGGGPASSRKRAARRRTPNAGARQDSQRSRRHGAHEWRRCDGQTLGRGGARPQPCARRRLGHRLRHADVRLRDRARRRLGQSAAALRRKRTAIPRVWRRALRPARDSIACLGVLRRRRTRTGPRAGRVKPPPGTRNTRRIPPGDSPQPTSPTTPSTKDGSRTPPRC